VIEYQHDNLDRTTAEIWKTGTTIVRTIDYDFDAASQLVGVSDPDAAYSFVFDDLGRTTQTTFNPASLTADVVMNQTFDANSARTQLAVTIGSNADFVNDYTRDNLSRVTHIEQHVYVPPWQAR
jgi:YD repeat-containing protein